MSPAIRNYILLFFGCLAFHLAGTWSLPLIDRDEPRFAEASREMRAGGDYVVPYFNNDYRFDKPPLTYWFQVASYKIFGENDFAARFPAAVAAALVAVVLFGWGRRIGNETTGWWAAIVFTFCLQTFLHGKAAVADMWLVLFVTLAHRAGWEMLFPRATSSNPLAAVIDRRDKVRSIVEPTSSGFLLSFWFFGFYFSLALAFLAKGPIGWAPLLTLICSSRWARRGGAGGGVSDPTLERGNAPALTMHLGGVLLVLGIVSAWGIPALLRTHGEFWNVGMGKHVIARSVATMEGHGASSPLMYVALLPFYFITLLASFFPWSLKLPALLRKLRARTDDTDRYLLVGTLVIFGIFTFVKTKLPHYTLPAFPLLALLLAHHADQLRLSRKLAMVTAAVMVAVALIAPPLVAHTFPAYDLARKTSAVLPPEAEFAAVDFNEPSVVWYFRRYLTSYMSPLKRLEAESFMQRPGPRLLVLPTETIPEIFPALDPAWRQFQTHGFNIPKGKKTDLTLLLKER